jgi:tetratricopeptide (TPR) repeat protein
MGDEGMAGKNELPHAYERLGDIFRDQGKFSEALVDYRKFLEFPTAGEGPSWQRDVAVVHGKIADMLVQQGDLPGAAQEFRLDLELSEKLAAEFPKTGDWLRGVVVAHERLGFVYREQAHLADAMREYKQDLTIADGLVKSDNANVLWRSDLALANEGLGDVSRDQHNWSAALEYYAVYLETMKRVSKDSPSSAKWRRDVAVGHQRLGDALLALDRAEEAGSAFEQCLSVSTKLTAAFDPRNPEPRDVHEYCRQRNAKLTSKANAGKSN